MSYVSVHGLGDAASDAAAAAAASAASSGATLCAAYAADLARWKAEQQAYITAVASRAATIAAAQAGYTKALKAYQAAAGGQAAGYAMQTARVLAQYKAKLPVGAPTCMSLSAHNTAANDCYLAQNPLHGLGAFDWTTVSPRCMVAALPVCQLPPSPPALPVAPPMPSLRAMPAMPKGCAPVAAPTVVTLTLYPNIRVGTVAVAPPTHEPVVPSAVTPVPIDQLGPGPEAVPMPVEASVAQNKSGAGLIVVAVLGAAAVGYLLLRKKKPAAA